MAEKQVRRGDGPQTTFVTGKETGFFWFSPAFETRLGLAHMES